MTEPAFTDNLNAICHEPECSTWNVTGLESDVPGGLIKAANIGGEVISDKIEIALGSLIVCCLKFFCH
jgi:hypothetical protein